MYKEVLTSINNVSIFPLISLVIFFGFFAFTVFRVMKADKKTMQEMAAIPLSEVPISLPINHSQNRR